jgi:acyl-CoA thioesterase FadM
MARIELTFPQPVVFTERLGLRTTDMSPAGHLGFDQLVRLVHHALNRFFDHCGLPIRGGKGISYIVKDLAVVYQGEAHAGETIEVKLGVGDHGKKWVELYFQVCRQADNGPGDMVEVATVKLAVICFDYAGRAAVPFPEAVRKEILGDKA